jgi:hypothetical protein
MGSAQDKDWFSLSLEAWQLAGEAASVIALRGIALAAGGPAAQREAQTMFAEKAEAAASLGAALAFGKLGTSPEAVAHGTISHYRQRVRANHLRLSGKG